MFPQPPAPREPVGGQAAAEFASELTRSAKSLGYPLDDQATRLLLEMLEGRLEEWRAGELPQARVRAHARKVVLWSVLRAADGRGSAVTGTDFVLSLNEVELVRANRLNCAAASSPASPPGKVDEPPDRPRCLSRSRVLREDPTKAP